MDKDLEEKNQLIEFVVGDIDSQVHTDIEIVAVLIDRFDLLGLHTIFSFFSATGFAKFRNQKQISELLKMSWPTFQTKRDELIKFGFLDTMLMGRKTIFKVNRVIKLPKFEIPDDSKKQADYLEKIKKQVVPKNFDYLIKQHYLEEQNIKKIKLDALVIEGVKQVEARKREALKREEKRFPNSDYELVLNAYRALKKVGLRGPEIPRAKKAIKQMFLAEHSPKQIIDCMKTFIQYQDEEGYYWMKSWTLETIMKKMPEFESGQLKPRQIGDDLELV